MPSSTPSGTPWLPGGRTEQGPRPEPDRLRIPPLVAVCGIVPLLPGLAIYHGLFAIVVDADIEGGLTALVGAAAVGLALAAGVTLGEYLGRPVSGARDRYDERVRRRAMTAA